MTRLSRRKLVQYLYSFSGCVVSQLCINNTWLTFAGNVKRQWSAGVSPPPRLYSAGLTSVPLPRGVEQHHTKGDPMPVYVTLSEGEYIARTVAVLVCVVVQLHHSRSSSSTCFHFHVWVTIYWQVAVFLGCCLLLWQTAAFTVSQVVTQRCLKTSLGVWQSYWQSSFFAVGSSPSWEALNDQGLLPDTGGRHEVLANTSKYVSQCGFAMYLGSMKEGRMTWLSLDVMSQTQ